MAKKTPAKRGPGRGKKTEPIVTRETLERIGSLWCRNRTLREIGEVVGLAPSVVHYHVNKSILPIWRAEMTEAREVELAKISNLERIAWERFDASQKPESRRLVKRALVDGGADLQVVERALTRITKVGETAWLAIVQWAVEQRLKISGAYVQDKLDSAAAGGGPVVVEVVVESREDAQRMFTLPQFERMIAPKEN